MPPHSPVLARAARSAAAVLALVVAGAPALAAQAVITGVVTDSLAGRPLRGAVVQLVPGARGADARTAATDSAGRFRIDSVPPGDYLVGFTHRTLDTLGLELPPIQLSLARGDTRGRVDLAIPSARTIVAAVCRSPKDASGLLVGRVLDADTRAPVPEARVAVRWAALVVDPRRGAARREERRLDLAVDDDGRFAACGVPTTAPVNVQATARDAHSGPLELRIPPPPLALLHRDLLVAGAVANAGAGTTTRGGRPSGSARVEGRVLTSEGSSVANAIVLVRGSGAPDSLTRSNPAGRFVLSALPAGTYTLEARAIGYHPVRAVVDLANGRSAIADLTLGDRITTLEPMRVYAAAPRRDLTGFVERSHGVFGRFITAADIERMHLGTVPDILRIVPGLQVEAGGGGYATIFSRGYKDLSRRCRPDVFIDGAHAMDGASALDAYVQPMDVLGIEVYVDFATVPVEYQRSSCGAILIWTKIGPDKR